MPASESAPDVDRPRGVREARGPQGGQGLVEYSLILALMAVVAVVALVFFGDAIAAALQFIGDEIDRSSS